MSDETQNMADKALAEDATEQPTAVHAVAPPAPSNPDETQESGAEESPVQENPVQENAEQEPEAESLGESPALEDDEQDQEADDLEENEPSDVIEESTAVEELIDKDEPIKMDWYILKVQSNRERSISDALRRKIAIEGLDDYFGDVVVPTEKITEFKGGKKKVVERKLYPGYIVVHMCINDDTWFAVRETAGIGDFTGAHGKPSPMLPHEVTRIIQTEEEETDDTPKLNITFKLGDRVKIKEGTFESFEGEVNEIDEHSGRVTVMINIFGRSTPVELEYWQAEQI